MPERVGWWTVGTVVVGGIFALSLYGFTFLNARVEASQVEYRTQIQEMRKDSVDQVKDLRGEFNSRLDRMDLKLDTLLRRNRS